jgi:hypothetical protein
MAVHVHVDSQNTKSDDKWKALSVQFAGGTIDSVEIHHGSPGQISAQHRDSFFQAAELGGAGLAWPSGLAATVHFSASTDMNAVAIDYESFNTYIVHAQDDVNCAATDGAPCAQAIYFGGKPPRTTAAPITVNAADVPFLVGCLALVAASTLLLLTRTLVCCMRWPAVQPTKSVDLKIAEP